MKLYKFPRTLHLPWSEGITSGDKVMHNTDSLNTIIYVSVKMDGENTTLYPDYLHARSLDSKHHPSRDWIKSYHAGIKHIIPKGWRICGENLYAKHSIHYKHLHNYFYVFAIFDEDNYCLDARDTILFCNSYGLQLCPLLFFGYFDKKVIQECYELYKETSKDEVEGYVVRAFNPFHYDNYSDNVAKYVRARHITTDQHWMNSKIIENEIII